MKAIRLVVVLCLFFRCDSLKNQKTIDICFNGNFSQKIERVSLKDIETIKKLNGNFVEMEGIFRYDFEDVALYPSKSASFTEAIWLDLTNSVVSYEKQLEKLNEMKVVVIGKVNIAKKGHLNGYLAELDSAFCIKAK